jgi:sec-independent protein translocase protein TatB
MFEVGFTEIVLIFGIALLVLGPARLPKLAADLGRWAGRARAMARQLRTQLEEEVNQFDPLAPDTVRKPAAGPIHSPAPAPAAPATPPADVEGQAMAPATDVALAEPAPAQAVPPHPDKDGL